MKKSSVVFVCLVMLIGLYLNEILKLNGHQSFHEGMQNADGCEVIFLGTSQASLGFDPRAAWSTKGIPSYNFSGNGQSIIITYHVLQEIYQKQNPKVVVLDFESIIRPNAFTGANAWYNLPAMGNWRHQLIMYREFFPDDSLLYYIPLFRWHENWKERYDNPKAFEKIQTFFGAELRSDITWSFHDLPQQPEVAELIEPDAQAWQYFKKIERLVQEHGARLVLVDMPAYDALEGNVEQTQGIINFVQAYAEENDIPFVSCNEKDVLTQMQLDPETDFRDRLHLNIDGAKKFSQYIAGFLADEFDLRDRRGDPKFVKWNEDLS